MRRRTGEEEEEEEADTELKAKKHTSMWGTKTPHVNVGKNQLFEHYEHFK